MTGAACSNFTRGYPQGDAGGGCLVDALHQYRQTQPLPAGSVWRIAEKANLNFAALYAALSPAIANDALTRSVQINSKANREFGKLEGGAVGVAIGGEVPRKSMELKPTAGTERGNITGLGYSA